MLLLLLLRHRFHRRLRLSYLRSAGRLQCSLLLLMVDGGRRDRTPLKELPGRLAVGGRIRELGRLPELAVGDLLVHETGSAAAALERVAGGCELRLSGG